MKRNVITIPIVCLFTVSSNYWTVESAFYVPGVAPESWQKDDNVLLNVNKITSVKTLLPYEYYDMPFCKPTLEKEAQENLGEIMAGDAIMNSLYVVQMKKNSHCNVLCAPMTYSSQVLTDTFVDKIEDNYFVDWVVDNLPVLYRKSRETDPSLLEPKNEDGTLVKDESVKRGFPLGEKDFQGRYFLYNHVKIIIYVNQDPTLEIQGDEKKAEDKWRIVGFEVTPSSIAHEYEGTPAAGSVLESVTCGKEVNVEKSSVGHHQFLNTAGKESTTVLYTYDVEFRDSETPWESRWDTIISSKTSNDQIHWFSILNSLMIVLFLSGVIGMITIRTLHKDITRYNEVSTTEDVVEESGWKLCHGDVFRPPQYSPLLFSVFVGTGVQVSCMIAATMVIALLGLLSPANRGSLLTTLLLLFVFMGSFAGFQSAKLYKRFHGKNWKLNTIMTAFMYPGSLFTCFFVLNLFLWSKKSSQAVPFGTLFALVVLWFGISAPLVFLGAYFGFKSPIEELPVRTNQIARQIPTQPWYLTVPIAYAIGGVLPFGAVFIEVFFIMSALWLHQIYYVFGFLFLVLLILVITVAQVTISVIYFQLCSENYEWYWNSFLISGSASVYLFLYSFVYFYMKLDISSVVSAILYFGYMAMISVTFFFLIGTVGYFSCFYFIKKIYGSIKVD